jgi:hypothetical protein
MPPPNIAMESGVDGLFFGGGDGDDDASDDDIDNTLLLLVIFLRLFLSSTEEREMVVNGVTGASRSDDRIIRSLIAPLSCQRKGLFSCMGNAAAAQLPWTMVP